MRLALGCIVAVSLAACGGPPATAPRSDDVEPAPRAPAPAPPLERVLPEPAELEAIAQVPLLGDALWQDDPGARDDALDALAEIKDSSAADTLSYLLSHHDPDVREDAVDALADLGTADVVHYLEQALQDSHPAVREAAEEGLLELGY